MAKLTTSEALEEIERERQELQQILVERNFKPLKALANFYDRHSRLREAAAGTDPATFGLGLAEIEAWCEQAGKTLLRSVDAQRRIEELTEQATTFDTTFDPARLNELEAKLQQMEQVRAELTTLSSKLPELLEENHRVRLSVDRMKQIGGDLDILFERAGSYRPIVRSAQRRQIWLRVLFVVAAFAGALLVGKAADFLYEHVLGRPLKSMAYLITTLLAFLLETVLIGRSLEARQEELHWKLYEDLLHGLDDDLAQIGNALDRLRQLVNTAGRRTVNNGA